MGHIRLGGLPQSKTWREVVALLEADAPLGAFAEAAALASERDLAVASRDPRFQFVSQLLVTLPLKVRSPEFHTHLDSLGISAEDATSVTGSRPIRKPRRYPPKLDGLVVP